MRERTPELFQGHVLASDGLYDVRAGNKHVARTLDHENKVGQRWRVDRATRTRSEDDRDLRNDSRCACIAMKDAAVSVQTRHAFLDACARAIVQSNDW